MPPIRAASARLTPSTTAASDSRRRLWLACLEAAARRRSSSAEKSTLTVTAVAMARILPHHGISSTSRGESPTSQNGRPLVLALTGPFRDRITLALDRLNQGMRRRFPGDKAMDIAIALEALLSDTGAQTEVTYRLALRSALLLGGNLVERKKNRTLTKTF